VSFRAVAKAVALLTSTKETRRRGFKSPDDPITRCPDPLRASVVDVLR